MPAVGSGTAYEAPEDTHVARGARRGQQSQLQQLERITDIAIQLVQAVDHLVQGGALAAQFLGLFGIIPDPGVLQDQVDFFQPFLTAGIVKDTPSALQRAWLNRPGIPGFRWGLALLRVQIWSPEDTRIP